MINVLKCGITVAIESGKLTPVLGLLYPNIKTFSPEQSIHGFSDIFHSIFLNVKYSVLVLVSLKCVPKGQYDYKSALVQVMIWRQAFYLNQGWAIYTTPYDVIRPQRANTWCLVSFCCRLTLSTQSARVSSVPPDSYVPWTVCLPTHVTCVSPVPTRPASTWHGPLHPQRKALWRLIG